MADPEPSQIPGDEPAEEHKQSQLQSQSQSQPQSEPQSRRRKSSLDGSLIRKLRALFPSKSGCRRSSTDDVGEEQSKRHSMSLIDEKKALDDAAAQEPRAMHPRRSSSFIPPALRGQFTLKRQESEMRHRLEPVWPSLNRTKRESPLKTETPLDVKNEKVPVKEKPDNDTPQTASVPDNSPSDLGSEAALTLVDEGLAARKVSHDSSSSRSSLDLLNPQDTKETDREAETEIKPTDSVVKDQIERDLETIWILNLSMRFRDQSKREKFFITYTQEDNTVRRVTVSIDSRDAPMDSTERKISESSSQSEKNRILYTALMVSLREIEFYNTVTNLKLETLKDNQLHVHVREDLNEIIDFPYESSLHHLKHIPRIPEADLTFDSHISGYVYRCNLTNIIEPDGEPEVVIKKEIPGPDSVDDFLYELHALASLRGSKTVIQLRGIVVRRTTRHLLVVGLLLHFAGGGDMLDALDPIAPLMPWPTRKRWARQIVSGLAEIHNAGFVQGDFTLSNIVLSDPLKNHTSLDQPNAKIIDINRRGCPVGWEPPELFPMIKSGIRISGYIGNKSDVYQLGMVLWALGTACDVPERYAHDLRTGKWFEGRSAVEGGRDWEGAEARRWEAASGEVDEWYKELTENLIQPNPKLRWTAEKVLEVWPEM